MSPRRRDDLVDRSRCVAEESKRPIDLEPDLHDTSDSATRQLPLMSEVGVYCTDVVWRFGRINRYTPHSAIKPEIVRKTSYFGDVM